MTDDSDDSKWLRRLLLIGSAAGVLAVIISACREAAWQRSRLEAWIAAAPLPEAISSAKTNPPPGQIQPPASPVAVANPATHSNCAQGTLDPPAQRRP